MTTSHVAKKKFAVASALAAAFALGGTGLAFAAPDSITESRAAGTDSEDTRKQSPLLRHGYVGNSESDVVARQAMKANTGLGAIEWEPQSLEAPKGFPEGGPEDGKIASAGTAIGANLDEQSSTRWAKNEVRPGEISVGWNFTAPHKTSKWHYYITKNGWDQNAPLSRAEFEPLATVMHDGSAASGNPTHTMTLPEDHTGYHVILAVWDVADTANAFYNVIDVDIDSDHPAQPDPEEPDNNPEDPENPDGPDANPDEPEQGDGAPSAPHHLHSMGITDNSVDLMWFESDDDKGVSHYEVQRSTEGGEFEPVASTHETSYLDSDLSASTSYQYKVVAFDADGNSSPASNVLSVKTTGSAESPDTDPEQPAGAPAWDPHGSYKAGDRVSHDGSVYEAVQSHKGNGDPTWISAPSLWTKV